MTLHKLLIHQNDADLTSEAQIATAAAIQKNLNALMDHLVESQRLKPMQTLGMLRRHLRAQSELGYFGLDIARIFENGASLDAIPSILHLNFLSKDQIMLAALEDLVLADASMQSTIHYLHSINQLPIGPSYDHPLMRRSMESMSHMIEVAQKIQYNSANTARLRALINQELGSAETFESAGLLLFGALKYADPRLLRDEDLSVWISRLTEKKDLHRATSVAIERPPRSSSIAWLWIAQIFDAIDLSMLSKNERFTGEIERLVDAAVKAKNGDVQSPEVTLLAQALVDKAIEFGEAMSADASNEKRQALVVFETEILGLLRKESIISGEWKGVLRDHPLSQTWVEHLKVKDFRFQQDTFYGEKPKVEFFRREEMAGFKAQPILERMKALICSAILRIEIADFSSPCHTVARIILSSEQINSNVLQYPMVPL